ncbi:MAG: aminoacyl-tRNA hydrolase [Oscillospiraceae bacterium]|jgi:PTH1 family peptidyl-tRNA hydrolase|nr:aminoacyl-tRNA hydrolase [Oscillospiraceae bacterium]
MSIFDIFNSIGHERREQKPVTYIIAGLGNDGAKYRDTRHNAGFMAIDMLAGQYNTAIKKSRFKAFCGETDISSHRVLLMKPLTMMNLSGQAVTEAMNFYKIPAENVLVLFDDISLPVGKIRIRQKGSDGGHNGMKNIIYLAGKDTFPRIKIGVGQKPHPDYDLVAWVLSAFKSEEIPPLKEACSNVCKAAELIAAGEAVKAMNEYN